MIINNQACTVVVVRSQLLPKVAGVLDTMFMDAVYSRVAPGSEDFLYASSNGFLVHIPDSQHP